MHALGADAFALSGAFSSVEVWSYPWERSLSGDEWVGLVATVSDHQRLGPERLAELLRALRVTIDELGGTISSHHETYALVAERV